MKGTNQLSFDNEESFGGEGFPACDEYPCEQVIICEHSLDFYECKICFKNKPIQKQKSTLEKFIKISLSPLYLIGWLVTVIFVGMGLLIEKGSEILGALVFLSLVVSAIYHVFFTFIPFLFNLFLLKRTIFTLHNSWNVLKVRNQLLNFVVMLFSQKICTCGVSSRESIPRIINLFISKKTLPIVNGFDHQRVDRVKINTGKEKVFTNNSKMKIVCVGALNKTKNQIALLKVLKKIQLDAEVIFLGDGLNSAYLKHFSENISKPTEIIFKGRVSRDLAIEHMLEADISISVSKGEGLPIAVLESMYAGCFTILSAIPPHLEISPPEDRCYFVDLDNAEDIENSLDYVQNNLNTIRSSRDISKEYTMLNFSVKNMLKEYRKVYESLISCEK